MAVVNQIGGKERYFFGNILWQTRALMDLAIGHKLAKGRPEREYLQTGDAVDSWKVIVVEPEKQLTLLFGMKAPGLGRLCFTLEDKGDYRTIDVRAFWHPHGMPGCLLVIDDPRASVYFSRNGKTNRQTGRTKHRLIDKTCVILSCFPLHQGGNHGRMRTSFSQQQWIDECTGYRRHQRLRSKRGRVFVTDISVRATGRNEAMGKILEDERAP